MTTTQTSIGWTAGAPPSKNLYAEGRYSTPHEKLETTGIRPFSIESLLSNCGSGCGTVFDAFKDHIRATELTKYWKVLYLAFEETTDEERAPASVAEKLDLIRDAFGLSMSAMSDVLRSSRASVYNWYETEPRGVEVLRRIDALHEIAQQWKDMNPYHYAPSKLMKQKLADGSSMLERLSQEGIDRDAIRQGLEGLLALMKKQRERMDRAKARSANVSSDDKSHKEVMEQLTGSVTADK